MITRVADEFAFIAKRAQELRDEAEREAKARARMTSTHCAHCGSSGWIQIGFGVPASVCKVCDNPDAKTAP